MPDFTALLRPRASDTKRPPPLPAELYPGVVKSYEYGDQNANKTPYVRYHLGLTGRPEKSSESDFSSIDLSRRQLRRDFFLTPDAYYRLIDFLKSCEIDIQQNSDGEVDLEAACPQVVGCPVTVEVQQYLNQNTNEIGNNVGRVFGPYSG